MLLSATHNSLLQNIWHRLLIIAFYLCQMVNGGKSLHRALSLFSSLVIQGKVPTSIHPFFFGANLIALEKKDGGIWPIAVGCTLRRLVVKIAGNEVTDNMSSLLAPQQLGLGVKGGAEAAVHSTCTLYHLACCF